MIIIREASLSKQELDQRIRHPSIEVASKQDQRAFIDKLTQLTLIILYKLPDIECYIVS